MRHVLIRETVQIAGELHFRSTTTGDNARVSQRALDNHDGVMETAFSLRDKLFSTATEDEGAGFGGRAIGEDVEALTANLALFEGATGS
ncbi:hypothetical protein ACKS0A_06603 [Histoplasma ohiense]